MNTIQFYSTFNNQSQLSKEEEQSLIKKVEQGDQQAKQQLVLSNLKYAVYSASKCKFSKLEPDDLIEQCALGLLNAADHVKSKYNNRFTTYANLWIKNSIDNGNNTCGDGIRLPELKYRLMKKVRGIYAKYSAKCDNDLECRKLTAQEVGIQEKEVDNYINISNSEIKLDGITLEPDKNDRTYEEILEDKGINFEDDYIKNDSRKSIRDIVHRLPKREADVLIKRFGLNGEKPMTFTEIGNFYGLTKGWANDIEKKARRLLLQNYKAELEEYYDYDIA